MESVTVKNDSLRTNSDGMNGIDSKFQQTGETIRLLARSGTFNTPTTTVAPGFVQANLIVLPSHLASDFRQFCARNPVPCPLLAETPIGIYDQLISHIPGVTGRQIANNVDLRSDFPRYMVYDNGRLANSHVASIEREWTEDHVAFLIGCSFSFDAALTMADLAPAHILCGRNVPMYRTRVPLCPAGVFKNSTYIVSMRPYRKRDIERVRDITRPYLITHGEPIDWGWGAVKRLGISNIAAPEYGDPPVAPDGTDLVEGLGEGEDALEPVFFGCGVTPQEAIQRAGLEGRIFAHAPGHMIVLDIKDSDIIRKI